MIACSDPLVLWGPSGYVLDKLSGAGKCQLTSRELLKHVENGRVQVIARENWISNKGAREKPRWLGATWTAFDDEIQLMCNRATGPEESRPVRIVEDETGYDRADEILSNPEKVDQVWELIELKNAPVGSLDRIKAKLGPIDSARDYSEQERRFAVREVLRDVVNHARAIELAGASVPFLDPVHDDYLRLMKAESLSGSASASEVRAESAPELSTLANEMVHLLAVIEGAQSPSTLEKFLDGEERRELIEWLKNLSGRMRMENPRAVGSFLLNNLEDQIRSGRRDLRWLEAVLGRCRPEKLLTLAGIMTVILSYLSPQTSISGYFLRLAGVGMTAFPILKGVGQKIGLSAADYSGPQWPVCFR